MFNAYLWKGWKDSKRYWKKLVDFFLWYEFTGEVFFELGLEIEENVFLVEIVRVESSV